jgi:hypothetical protein
MQAIACMPAERDYLLDVAEHYTADDTIHLDNSVHRALHAQARQLVEPGGDR